MLLSLDSSYKCSQQHLVFPSLICTTESITVTLEYKKNKCHHLIAILTFFCKIQLFDEQLLKDKRKGYVIKL